MLIERILAAQKGSQDDMLYLIEKFMPLLKRYSYRLHAEDAMSDLTLSLIEIVKCFQTTHLKCNSDGVVVNYISKSIRNAYISYLPSAIQNGSAKISWEELTDAQKPDIEYLSNEQDYLNFRELLDACPSLTEKERNILTDIYFYGYTAAELGRKLGLSKQNINQTKMRALKKLRQIKT